MNASRIDEAILAAAQPSWRKVAMIVVTAAKAEGIGVTDGEAGHRAIAARIQWGALIAPSFRVVHY